MVYFCESFCSWFCDAFAMRAFNSTLFFNSRALSITHSRSHFALLSFFAGGFQSGFELVSRRKAPPRYTAANPLVGLSHVSYELLFPDLTLLGEEMTGCFELYAFRRVADTVK
jgi:hypothetical protein